MTTRNSILNQLLDDLTKINYANGYDSDVSEVRRGANLPDSVYNYPFLCFINSEDTLVDQKVGRNPSQHRVLSIQFYGYAKTDVSDYDPVHNLLSALEQFLETSDWTYYQETLVGDVVLWEGVGDEDISAFKLNITVNYNKQI